MPKKKQTRAERLRRAGIYKEVMWHEGFKENHPGHFEEERARLETETTEDVFDRWCRGQNLMRYAELILNRVDVIRRITRRA